MKRIFALCMVCMVLMEGVASAEISKGKDSFTGGLSVSSSVDGSPIIKNIFFVKIIYDNNIKYDLRISEINNREYLLKNSPLEIKIDDFPIYELSNYHYNVSGPDSYGVKFSVSISAQLSSELVDKLKVAKRVALRFTDGKGTRWPYILSDDILNEWKQVINTKE